MDIDDEQQQLYQQKLTSLRVLECLNEKMSDLEETSVTIQDTDRENVNRLKNDIDALSRAAPEGPVFIPASNLKLISGIRSMDSFVTGVGVGLPHIGKENL